MNKWILAGSLGAFFLITLVFSYGPGYGGSLLAFLNGNTSVSPEMSPSDMVTPMVTKLVTSKIVTNVTTMSPVLSPMSPSTYISPANNIYSQIPVTSHVLTISPQPSPKASAGTASYTPTPMVTTSPVVTPSSTIQPQNTPLSTQTPTPTPVSPQLAKININTAGLSELDHITGVGPVIAQRIIDYRTTNGPFQKIEDIVEVKGIGDATFQKMKEQITVGS